MFIYSESYTFIRTRSISL